MDALKRGQRYDRAGEKNSLKVLEEVFPEANRAAQIDLGVVEIPLDRIVGTYARGRNGAFAGNFMPLLGPNSEFGQKWVALCMAHLGDTGITDPILCFEYMGMFYVREGNKRVSVMKYFDAATISGRVTRLMPPHSDDPAVLANEEFIRFYQLSGSYAALFRKPGCYERLQAAMGFAPDHAWSKEERSHFASVISRMQAVCDSGLMPTVDETSASDALLTYLGVYPYAELDDVSDAELKKRLTALLPQLRFIAQDEPVAVSTEPEIPEQSVISRIISGIAKSVLQVAFIHAADPKRSRWSLGHEEGRLYLEKVLGDQVKTTSAVAAPGEAYEAMEQAVAGGAQVVFVTAPTLLAEARRLAAAHPGLKVLVCALSVPYGGIRTYYSRIYEGKFITGAIAGALSHGHPIGYIARYPILGTPASINAFALGARMTDPEAKIILKWSCLPGQPVQELLDSHVRALSGHEAAVAEDMRDGLDWSTCLIDEGGAVRPLASVCWDWGQQYEQLIRSIRSGGWESDDPANESAVSYWWGMSSGVVDVRLADTVPAGVRKLAEILQRDIRMSILNPFDQVITDQEGRIHSPEDHWMNPEALMRMSWLCDNVEGRIPTVDEVLPRSQETTRLLSLQP